MGGTSTVIEAKNKACHSVCEDEMMIYERSQITIIIPSENVMPSKKHIPDILCLYRHEWIMFCYITLCIMVNRKNLHK